MYDKQFEVPAEFRPHELMVNCRNTQRIHREVMKLYEGDIAPLARGPEGRDIELYRNDDPAGTITQVLERLCGKEEVAPQDVVVLSSHALERSHVAPDVGGRWGVVFKYGEHRKARMATGLSRRKPVPESSYRERSRGIYSSKRRCMSGTSPSRSAPVPRGSS